MIENWAKKIKANAELLSTLANWNTLYPANFFISENFQEVKFQQANVKFGACICLQTLDSKRKRQGIKGL